MAISTIYPNGVNEVIVPATQSIAISNFGGGIASIYYLIVNANRPAAYQLQQTLNNSSVVLGAFADGMTIKIEAGQSVVRYDVGASPDTGIGDADTLNGLASDTAATADTIAARDSSGDITANAFESTVATGTAPLTVASTTVVSNLNADLLDGQEGSYYATLSTDQTFTGAKIIGDLYGTIGSTSILTAATTLTPAQMDSKVIRIGAAATETVTMTLPTEADMEAYFTGMDDLTTFEISICNEDTSFTGVIANSDFTALIGNMTIATQSSACFLVRRSTATSWLLYRKAG